ncbi:EIN3-binding F-box protein 1 [Dendrobium catenatum]|uniref:EIN3-binding F-box protein 1 n=1 Tax=Dendrobium catenatum TaxID=906689 RepID=A0A2I0X7C9_9ASPA|nr:EIN3-binding F-box protein 1 [Dendrobium catenatum]PKU83823.1 EIN3-binding F-box protein 1 [Dendrobium catenatum]
MAALLNFPGDDEIRLRGMFCSHFMDSSLFLSLAPTVDVCYSSWKRSRVTAPSIIGEELMKTAPLLKKQLTCCSIDALPDECLFEILRRLPRSQERSIAACVSKRWLMLLSNIQPSEDMDVVQKGENLLRSSRKPLPDLNYPEPLVSELNSSIESGGYITRCLEAEEATDVRLAAIAVSNSSRGGIGKLKIRGGNSTCKVTDAGLSAIGRGCPLLRVLSIWKVPLITDAGLAAIADGCPLLENLDLCQCPLISDKGLIAIAQKCPNLTSLTIDSCSSICNDGLQALGHGCSKLISISIKDCPLVGDKGVSSLVAHASSSIMKIKLQNVNISDVTLAVIGHYGKAVTNISLNALQNVSERGFWVMGNALNLVNLTSCTISCCPGATDRGLEAIAKGCPRLKMMCIKRSPNLSDAGLKSFTGPAKMLERLQLEECNGITLVGVFESLLNCCSRFRGLALVKCLGIKDISCHLEELPTCMSLKYLTIRDCPGFTSCSLSMVGKLCPSLQQIDLTRLVGVTDAGILPLLECSQSELVKVNLEGCVSLSDASISSLVKAHGSSLKFLSLKGCKGITDRSLLSISANCSVLKDLDVSCCSISDFGVAAIASAKQLNLRTLSLAGCAEVTKKSLSFLEKMKESLEGLNLQQCKLINTHVVGSFEEKLWWCDILS